MSPKLHKSITNPGKKGPLLLKLLGYLILPHELLHVLGYRLAGKRCRYRPGQLYVAPERPLTRRQALIGLLCPAVVCALVGLAATTGFTLTFLAYYHHTRAPLHLLASLVLGAIALPAGSSGHSALIIRPSLPLNHKLKLDSPLPQHAGQGAADQLGKAVGQPVPAQRVRRGDGEAVPLPVA